MSSPARATRELVLIGAGHTNLHVLRQWRIQPIPNVRLTLITPFRQAAYSGMLSGTLAGLYQSHEMQIDLCRFTAGTDIRLIIAEATGLDPDKRFVAFTDRPAIHFDVATVGIGSVPNHSELWTNSDRIVSIKPMATFVDRLNQLVASTYQSERSLRCAIVGGGAAGTEISFCLDAMLRQKSIPHHLTLLDHHAEILPGYAPVFVRQARQILDQRGIAIRVGQKVTDIKINASHGAHITLENDSVVPVDFIIWATSASPPRAMVDYALPRDAAGFLTVRSTLQSTADVPVFIVGDSATFIDQLVPKAGVYAVREGPILWQNIQRLLSNRPLIPFRPQRHFLSLLSTGDGKALMHFHGWTAYGTWAWYLKNYIDRRFVRQYQNYES